MAFRRIVRTLKRAQRPVIRGTQFVLLNVFLFLLYYVGFTITRLFLSVAARRMLYHRPRRRPEAGTGWREAAGYELDEARVARQS